MGVSFPFSLSIIDPPRPPRSANESRSSKLGNQNDLRICNFDRMYTAIRFYIASKRRVSSATNKDPFRSSRYIIQHVDSSFISCIVNVSSYSNFLRMYKISLLIFNLIVVMYNIYERESTIFILYIILI